MKLFSQWLEAEEHGPLPPGVQIKRSQGDGWMITIPQGYIDYRHDPERDTNEIWWVETTRRGKGYGKKLVDLMQMAHPASVVAWGVTTPEGKDLRDSWHKKNPGVEQSDGAFDGQFDPSGNNYGQEEEEEEEEEEEDDYYDEEE